METEQKNLQEIMKFRLEKLEKIKDSGINPYAYNFNKKDAIESLTQKGEGGVGEKVITAGRMVSFRKMGKASFTHIQDESGKIQIYLKNDLLPDTIYDNIVRNLDLGDIVGCTGELFITKMGELSIKADNIHILSKNIRPLPNMKEKEGESFNAFEDKELRYRHRQLDLIANPDIKTVFKKRAKIISSTRKYLDDNGFIEVETPVLQPVYGGASARPFTTFHNTLEESLYLRIADELYLKRLIVGGFEKVYELGRIFRNEGISTRHNPEFTSVEIYQAFADYYQMMDLTEDLLSSVCLKICGTTKIKYQGQSLDLTPPWKRVTMKELVFKETGLDFETFENDSSKAVSAMIKVGLEVPSKANTVGRLMNEAFEQAVESKLIQPTFVQAYPIEISPLAR